MIITKVERASSVEVQYKYYNSYGASLANLGKRFHHPNHLEQFKISLDKTLEILNEVAVKDVKQMLIYNSVIAVSVLIEMKEKEYISPNRFKYMITRINQITEQKNITFKL